MPEEETGGIDREVPPTSQDDSGTQDEGASPEVVEREEAIPRQRFDEVNQAAKNAAQENAALRHQQAQMMQNQQNLQNLLATQLQKPEADPTEAIREKYGDDPEGKAAFDTIYETADIAADRKVREALAKNDAKWNAKFDGAINSITGQLKQNQHFDELRSSGRITDESEAKIKNEMGVILNQDPSYQAHPDFTRKMAIANLVERGEWEAPSSANSSPQPQRGPDEMPGAPTGLRGARDMTESVRREEEDARLNTLRRRMPSLAGYSPKQMREKFGGLADHNANEDEGSGIKTADGELPAGLLGGVSYQHTRRD